MYQFMPGYEKAVVDAVMKLVLNPALKEVVFSNGSGLKMTRDDAFGQAKKAAGGKLIATQKYKEQNFLIFAP
jgi:hypothetical protein